MIELLLIPALIGTLWLIDSGPFTTKAWDDIEPDAEAADPDFQVDAYPFNNDNI